MKRGQIWWADLPEPSMSEPGYRRPVVIMQSNVLNRSRIDTVVVVSLTSNLKRAGLPGNVRLPVAATGLKQASVVNVTQIATVDKHALTEMVGHLDFHTMQAVDEGVRLAIGL